ncbi:MAG: hypothetical protein NTX25_19140, partial [Proteobacteria bacterium]|nr:hypothetical protein [Pseudomonadota bacterium]
RGEGCGQAQRPGVYTRVASYKDWIRGQRSLISDGNEQDNKNKSGSVEIPNSLPLQLLMNFQNDQQILTLRNVSQDLLISWEMSCPFPFRLTDSNGVQHEALETEVAYRVQFLYPNSQNSLIPAGANVSFKAEGFPGPAALPSRVCAVNQFVLPWTLLTTHTES